MPIVFAQPVGQFPPSWTSPTETQGFRNTGQDSRDQFGFRLDVTSDNNRILVGTPDAWNGQPGLAHTFTRSGDVWTQEDELTASDGSGNDGFGGAVSISNDGTKAIVGAHDADKVYYFTRSGSVWTEQQIITGPGDNNFGYSVAISGDGNYMVIGEPLDDTGGFNAGRVHLYALVAGTWVFRQIKYMTGDGNNSNFGWSCSMSDDGFRFVASAQNDPANSQNGFAVVFHGNGTTWSENAKLNGYGESHTKHGFFVHMTGDGLNLVYGGILNDVHVGLQNVGAAYIYNYSGSWNLVQRIRAGDPQSDDDFGSCVWMSEDAQWVVAGAPREDTGGSGKGSAYVFKLDGTWSQVAKIQSTTATSFFGGAVIMSEGGEFILSASHSDAAPGGTVFYFKG